VRQKALKEDFKKKTRESHNERESFAGSGTWEKEKPIILSGRKMRCKRRGQRGLNGRKTMG